jgi:hypothetical protein
MIRVVLPNPLCVIARTDTNELALEVPAPVTQRTVLDAVEARFPMLRGTLRDHQTQKRRAFVRFYACEKDLSHNSPDEPLPAPVVNGKEPFIILGAIVGG